MRRPIARDQNQRKRAVSSQVSSWVNFTPLSLQPSIWLDAADASTVTVSGSAVTQWNDKSGNGRNFVQGTSTRRPTYVADVQNGLSVVRTALNQNVQNLSLGNVSQPIAFVCVVRTTSSSSTYQSIIFARSDTDLIPRAEIWWNGIDPQIRMNAGGTTISLPATLGGTVVASGRFNGSNSTLFVNEAITQGNTSTDGIVNGIGLGRMDSLNFQGDYCEFLAFYRFLTTSEIFTLSKYLRIKWGF